MGYDYSNHQVFGGDDVESVRKAVIDSISTLLPHQTNNEDEATRSVVVGTADRWIFVGDSAGSTENADPEAFDQLSLRLSQIAPTIAIKMSDCATVHIFLYRDGEFVDKFGNGTFPWYRFKTPKEAEPFKGVVTEWASLLASHATVESLREIWSQQGDANSIVANTARLFGLDAELAEIGYSVFDEADEIKYDGYLPEEVDLSGFSEFHFVSRHSAT